jgi:hypothetical protein
VITNLVLNAKHAMPTGGELIISAKNILAQYSELGKDSVEIKIRDKTAQVFPQTSWLKSSIPTSPPSKPETVWVWQWCTVLLKNIKG